MGTGVRKITLCDTINHPTPILLEWGYGLADLGYDVSYLPIPQHSIRELDQEIDMLIYAGIQPENLVEFEEFRKKNPNTTIIGASDHWKPEYVKFIGVVDYFIGALDKTPQVKNLFNQNGFQYYNIPLAANHLLFNKVSTPKIYDACFIGNLSHGYRGEDRFLYPILDKYNCFLGGMTYGKYTQGFIAYDQHNLIRNQSTININFHVPYQKPGKGEFIDRVDCNQSVFNIALSGNFQLCDHPLALEYFKGNVVIGDEDNWLDLFEYYLHNPQEREEKAHQAMLIAQQEHTWVVRMKQFMEVNENHNKINNER
jgi:spore maturation protein CgeB